MLLKQTSINYRRISFIVFINITKIFAKSKSQLLNYFDLHQCIAARTCVLVMMQLSFCINYITTETIDQPIYKHNYIKHNQHVYVSIKYKRSLFVTVVLYVLLGFGSIFSTKVESCSTSY